MKKVALPSILMLFIGMISGIILVTNFESDLIGDLFAKEKMQLGAKSPPAKMSEIMSAINQSVVSTSEAVLISVVSIKVVSEYDGNDNMMQGQDLEEFFKFFSPRSPKEDQDDDDSRNNKREKPRREGGGSGVVITNDGYIVTNNHVVENAIENGIEVTMYDKKKYIATLVGTDPLTDLAVLKIEANDLKSAHLADVNSIKVGEMVVAVGSPLGLNSTVTSGIVSAIGRGRIGLNNSSYSVENYIQTDAAINPGNSGGGLFDMNGSLIGINTAIATGTGNYIGYGFAIPVDLVQSVIEDLIEDGEINRGYIGVQIKSIEDEVEAKAFGLNEVSGILVNKVLDESAADKAGINKGDIILEVNGKKVNTSQELQSQIALFRAGDKVKLTLWRDNKKINKDVILKSKDNDDLSENVKEKSQTGKPIDDNGPVEFDNLGFSIKPIDSKTKSSQDIRNGVVVVNVKKYSIADKRNLFTNSIITKVGNVEINSTSDLKKIIESKKPGDVILMQVTYKETNQFVALEIPKKEG